MPARRHCARTRAAPALAPARVAIARDWRHGPRRTRQACSTGYRASRSPAIGSGPLRCARCRLQPRTCAAPGRNEPNGIITMVPTQDLISARNRTLKSQHGMAGHSMIPARAIRVWVGLGLPADYSCVGGVGIACRLCTAPRAAARGTAGMKLYSHSPPPPACVETWSPSRAAPAAARQAPRDCAGAVARAGTPRG